MFVRNGEKLGSVLVDSEVKKESASAKAETEPQSKTQASKKTSDKKPTPADVAGWNLKKGDSDG